MSTATFESIDAVPAPGTGLATLGGPGGLVPGTPEFREHVERGAAALAREFAEAKAEIRRLWLALGAQSDRIRAAFPNAVGYNPFRIDIYYEGRGHHDYPGEPAIDRVLKDMNKVAWKELIDRLGVKSLMSVRRREEFERQMEKGDLPEVTEENIVGVICGMASQAADFAVEAAKEVLKLLTPTTGRFKTNSGFKVGRRVILPNWIERKYDGRGYHRCYHFDAQYLALDGVFLVLDEKGCLKGPSPLAAAIDASPDGRGETDYFRFKCFKNRNLHLEFKRLDLVQKLNGLATGEFILGDDTD